MVWALVSGDQMFTANFAIPNEGIEQIARKNDGACANPNTSTGAPPDLQGSSAVWRCRDQSQGAHLASYRGENRTKRQCDRGSLRRDRNRVRKRCSEAPAVSANPLKRSRHGMSLERVFQTGAHSRC
jgi:hypothetical protein